MSGKETNFSNETHQLLVTVSRHLYLDKKGVINYQKKPFDINISNYGKSNKEHLVYYAMLDHFSGNFIFDLGTTRRMLPLADFLHFAWRKEKKYDHFYGLPLSVSVPKRISSPGLLEGLQSLGVEPFHPVSGFSSGVHVIKKLEENILFSVLHRSALHYLGAIDNYKKEIYWYMLEVTVKGNCIEIWRDNLPPEGPAAGPGYDQFVTAFPASPDEKAVLPLVASGGPVKLSELKPLPRFLTAPVEELPFSQEKLDKAQDLIFEAWEWGGKGRGLKWAYEALETSPFCADALNYLASRSSYTEEQLFLYRRAVQVGEAALGELFFKKNSGHFWDLIETRPYMRALFGLADCLWKTGRKDEAIKNYWELLRLNPGDNQGIRYVLGFRLLEENRPDELDKLFKEHDSQQENSCFMLYNKALHLFRKGDSEAERVLQQAIKSNDHVYSYLSGEESVPFRLPASYSPGACSEAEIYAAETKQAWNKAPGALAWVQKALLNTEESDLPRQEPVTIEQVLQEFLDDQALRLKEGTLDKYGSVIELLEACLEGYGHNYLDEAEGELFEQHYDSAVDEETVFCRLFGPEKIADNTGEFLGYFMPHKVICGEDLLCASGTVMKKLSSWLLEKGYIDPDASAYMKENAEKAIRYLPAADRLSNALFDYVESQPFVEEKEEELADLFKVIKVEPGRIHLEGPGSEEAVVVKVPARISQICREGFMLNLLLIKTKKGWEIAEAGSVYIP